MYLHSLYCVKGIYCVWNFQQTGAEVILIFKDINYKHVMSLKYLPKDMQEQQIIWCILL